MRTRRDRRMAGTFRASPRTGKPLLTVFCAKLAVS
jgi:hypothetical protein